MKTGALSLALSALALGVAVFALARDDTAQDGRTARSPMRTKRDVALEARVEELARELASLKARQPRSTRPAPTDLPWTPPTEGDDVERPAVDIPEDEDALVAIVDDAVDRKTKEVLDEFRVKANKKPEIDVFASVLELTGEQRAETERVVVQGQRQVHEILNTPTADGTVLMDGLIEIVAQGMARPGRDPGWGPWFGRIVSEKIPGTDVTYAARIEAVKTAMRESFKRDWSKEQYQEFEQWGVDPTEIQNVPDSPNAALMERIAARARALGAEIPKEDE